MLIKDLFISVAEFLNDAEMHILSLLDVILGLFNSKLVVCKIVQENVDALSKAEHSDDSVILWFVC